MLISEMGSSGHDVKLWHNKRRFRLSFVYLVHFLRKSTEFHANRKECQIILPTAYFSRSPVIAF